MPYSSGTYSLPSGNPVVSGTTISSSTTNTTNSDIATALSTCILKDGTQTITANLPMASHKLTGLSAGTTAGDSVEYGGSPSFTNLAYTGTLTGSTGILNIGSGQIYKDASGNVGIGTSSPSSSVYKLTVAGDVGAGAGISIRSDSSTSAISRISFTRDGTDGTTGLIRVANSDYSMQFWTANGTNNSERMRIDSVGSLYLNTTSQVGNTAQVMGLKFNGATQWGISFGNLNSSNAGSAINFCNYAGTQIGTIQLSASATAYVTSSDYRLKENIQPMVGALDTIAQLKPVTYTWLEDGANGQGFIAHELQEIFPDAVAGEKDAVAEDGSIIPQGIDPSKLVATLTAAIQELKAIIDTQQEQINSLLGK